MLLTEILFTCWLILLGDGSLFCYCEGEPVPAPIVQPAEPVDTHTVYLEIR